MANNYTETSFIVTMRDTKEQQGVLDMLSDLEQLACSDPESGPFEFTWPSQAVKDLAFDMDVGDYGVGFECDADGDNGLWIHGTESVNVEQVAVFFSWVLRHFNLSGNISFMWADYCSKPRLGEQGGGACFITAEETKWMSTYQWVREQELQRKKENG